MTDSDGEIEYLDEDADIVKQCVQTAQLNAPILKNLIHKKDLLVERLPVQMAKRAKPRQDDSSDYDPTEDLRPAKKRRANVRFPPKQVAKPNIVARTYSNTKLMPVISPKLEVKIPDYDDPLCLPVKYWGKDNADTQQRRKWNALCLRRLDTSIEDLKPPQGDAVLSRRIVMLRNVTNNDTRKPEVSMWSKTVVENKDGERNTEVLQMVLPKFREKTLLDYNLPAVKKKKFHRAINSVILAKEEHKDGPVLVAYQPEEGVSQVYKLLDVPENPDTSQESSTKRYMDLKSCVKVCAPCFQASWRPMRAKQANTQIKCPICGHIFLSVYNLLSHSRTHNPKEIREHKKEIARILARIVEYHYKCRICQKSILSIKGMREHVLTHNSKLKFTCEVCNHITK